MAGLCWWADIFVETMKIFSFAALLLGVSLHGQTAPAPADDIGHRLLAQMVEALGGPAWLNLKEIEEDGRIASFSHGAPTGSNVQFFDFKRLPNQERIEYARPRDLMPGSVRDVIQVWTADQGYEVTYKGKKPLLALQVEEYNRLRKAYDSRGRAGVDAAAGGRGRLRGDVAGGAAAGG